MMDLYPLPPGFDAEDFRDGTFVAQYRSTGPTNIIVWQAIWLIGWLSGSALLTFAAIVSDDWWEACIPGAFLLFGLFVALAITADRCSTVTFMFWPDLLVRERVLLILRWRREILRERVTAIRSDEYSDENVTWTLKVVADRDVTMLQSSSLEQIEWLGRVLVRWSGMPLTDQTGKVLMTVEDVSRAAEPVRTAIKE
jgi:hypothetical protein